jgi:hypothetical protein
VIGNELMGIQTINGHRRRSSSSSSEPLKKSTNTRISMRESIVIDQNDKND